MEGRMEGNGGRTKTASSLQLVRADRAGLVRAEGSLKGRAGPHPPRGRISEVEVIIDTELEV